MQRSLKKQTNRRTHVIPFPWVAKTASHLSRNSIQHNKYDQSPVNEWSITESLYVLANSLVCVTEDLRGDISKQSIKNRKCMTILNIDIKYK